ncbi:NAD(P)H-binding protein [Sphingomonas sp. CGMCC 1.13654]|uniref:NAD(P)H-binding protein n=1 Tax=Sphingomonas chungangi TaxID=2683589 RepID=A0A838L355_9SPHN|nr:NAD(P)H-binding protein [Sphingomonas chungangi]MBA2933497.1 NAD(P)H-binding protein [Sphingomonas chungangi]MVW54830.1 NAD(P)H-binding protein [Sphingomonas chungangi]
MILLTAAGSRTQRHVLSHLRDAGQPVRAFGRSLDRGWFEARGVTDLVEGDMLDRDALRRTMAGIDTVVHLGPGLNGNEAIMGRFAIDAAREAGVRRFVYISVIFPQIDYLMNHRAKRQVEDHLISSRLTFTIVQPQHYFQNIDVKRCLETGVVALPYAMDRRLGFVDMADLGEAVGKVVTEPGHDFAYYPISSDENLSGEDIAAALSRIGGKPVGAHRIPLDEIVAMLAPHFGSADGNIDASADIITRLFTYYDRYGIPGNGRVLEWLLGRPATTFEQYAARSLEGGAE